MDDSGDVVINQEQGFQLLKEGIMEEGVLEQWVLGWVLSFLFHVERVKWKDGRERVSLASATSTCAPRVFTTSTSYRIRLEFYVVRCELSLPTPVFWLGSHIESVIAAMAGVSVNRNVFIAKDIGFENSVGPNKASSSVFQDCMMIVRKSLSNQAEEKDDKGMFIMCMRLMVQLEEERKHLINISKPHTENLTVVDSVTCKSKNSRVCTSSGIFLDRGQDETVRAIQKRIPYFTFLHVG
nr:probable prolyl 4-hydroxylase 10 [Tanacetum cinerariifolium]